MQLSANLNLFLSGGNPYHTNKLFTACSVFSWQNLCLCFLLIIACLGTQQVQAQGPEPPVVLCANRNSDGVEIRWEKNENSNCGGLAVTHTIYVANNSAGPYTEVVSLPITGTSEQTYTDLSANINNNTLFYYIEERCGTQEPARSSVVDTDFPVAPQAITATVLGDSTVLVTWIPSVSPETAGYVLYRVNENGGTDIIATIDGVDNTLYIDASARPESGPESYKIAAFDHCLGADEPGPDNNFVNTTMFLTAAANSCDNSIQLNWTAYEGWQDGIREYIIIEQTENDIILLDTIPSNTQTYTYFLPNGQEQACFEIRARHNNGADASMSNLVCVDINASGGPSSICLTNITVENGQVLMNWYIDPTSPIIDLHIDRGSEADNLRRITTAPLIASDRSFVDAVNTSRMAMHYQVVHEDACGKQVKSGIGRPILLQGNDQFNSTNRLSWTAFELENAMIINYVVYRSETDSSDFVPVATVESNVTEFIDNELSMGSNNLCYYVEAQFALTCPEDNFSEMLVSTSNQICILQSSRIFVPNAFMPNSGNETNSVFKPVILHANANNYSMIVVNRWGKQVFTTSDPSAGWDGRLNGKVAPQGVYVYMIKMVSDAGFPFERKGTVLLIR